jgi:lipoprotein-releasing system ATP-binding protein
MAEPFSLTIENLHKVHRSGDISLHVLRGINLSMDPGEKVVITGVSGSGKSTLLHILGGLDHPTEGKVLLGDLDLYALSEAERTRLRREEIGFVFQFHHLLEDFSALENVMIPLIARGLKKREARIRAEEILGALGLSDRLHHRPSELSGGEQQRVAIARALTHRPRLLLMDEPTGNLDPETAGMIHRLLFDLAETLRYTWVTVTHNESFAREFPRRLKLFKGEIAPL